MSSEEYIPLIQVITPIALGVLGFIQAVTLALIALITRRSKAIKEDAAATKDQIVNHHPQQPNYRDQQDARHAETKRWFENIRKEIRQVEKHLSVRLGKVESTTNDLIDGWYSNRERIENLENTQTSKEKENE